jgi:hypothetical protein
MEETIFGTVRKVMRQPVQKRRLLNEGKVENSIEHPGDSNNLVAA